MRAWDWDPGHPGPVLLLPLAVSSLAYLTAPCLGAWICKAGLAMHSCSETWVEGARRAFTLSQ